MIKSEFIKLHRCNIIWVGIIVLPFAPLLAVLQQSSLNDPVMDYGYINLINAVIWNNMALFLPATLTLLGGYMMNREYIDDTLKEIFIIPVSYRKLMAGKLGALYLLAVMYSIYSFCITTIISIFYCPAGLTVSTFMKSFFQICGMGIFICTAVMPVVCWCGSSKTAIWLGQSCLLYMDFSVYLYVDIIFRIFTL